jgi:superfamily II DNA or RNA helicase
MVNDMDPYEQLNMLMVSPSWRQLGEMTPGAQPWGRWHHQYEACSFIEDYLIFIKSTENNPKAGLVRMPTGTGKTGVMAIVANYIELDSSILIVVPSEFLTDQVEISLNLGYWITIGKRPPYTPKKAITFVPTTLREELAKNKTPTVFICTTQTLSMIYTDQMKWSGLYYELKNRVDLLLVDEGHREPARTWAKAVRSLDHPVILFSATPYRNDLRMFRIGRGKEFRFSIRFQESVEANVIRDIIFRYPENSFVINDDNGESKRDPARFADELLSYYHNQFQQEIPSGIAQPKVIIRCESIDSIRQVYEAMLEVAKRYYGPIAIEKVIAIHEDYRGSKYPYQLDAVPRTGSIKDAAFFWIHQFKLTEGIDNSEFCLLAFYEPFLNSRSLIQQIGRILRNPSGDKNSKGIVFTDKADKLETEWKNYLEFEKSPQDILGAEDIVHAIREAQPKWYYASGRYRTGVDFLAEDLWEDIRIPKTVRVYLKPKAYSIDDLRILATSLAEYMEDQDMVTVRDNVEKAYDDGSYSVSTFHWEIIQSKHLEEKGFFDIKLVFSYFYMNDKHIFYHGRFNPASNQINPALDLEEIEKLEYLIPNTDALIKQLSLVNCDLGDSAVRRKSLGGRSLGDSAAFLNDHLHFMSSLVFQADNQQRYLGLQNSTISDRTLDYIALDDFRVWLEAVEKNIRHNDVDKNKILQRYARPIRAPRSASAKHLLLDLGDFYDEYKLVIGDYPYDEDFVATACDVSEAGDFTCSIMDKSVTGNIRYSKRRFIIKSDDLNKYFMSRHDKNRRPASFLSNPTVMRVVTDNGLIYSDGRFFNTNRLHGRNRVHDLDIIISVPGLENIVHDEKGQRPNFGDNTWQPGSLFNLIDTDRAIFTSCNMNPDIIICDDMGTEVADFIAVDSEQKKIALLHAKVFSDQGSLSAKSMHEVVAQAKKNLGFLDSAERITRSRWEKWDKKWKWNKNSINGLPRIRCCPDEYPRGKDIMQHIQNLLHSTSVQKEVWLVLGNAFTGNQLREVVLSDGDIRYYWTQLLYLIHSCHASVTAMGAQLRILTGVPSE